MADLLKRHSIELVVHFSGNAYVGESMVHPEAYYQNITVRAAVRIPCYARSLCGAPCEVRTDVAHASTDGDRAWRDVGAPNMTVVVILAGIDGVPGSSYAAGQRGSIDFFLILRNVWRSNHIPHHRDHPTAPNQSVRPGKVTG